MMNNSNKANLPRCVSKGQLKEYFGCSYDFMWANLLTDELLMSWNINLEEVKRRRLLGPDLTRRIYVHFKITDLDANFSEEVRNAITQGKPCTL